MVNNVFPKLRRSEITIVREIPEVAKETLEPVSSVSELLVSRQEEALRIVSLISLWEKV